MKKQTTQLDPTTFEGSNEDMIWDLCRIQQWGVGYFGADKDGDAYVCPDPEHPKNKVKIIDIVKFAQQKSGLKLPALLSFPQILQHRLKSINAAFKKAREDFGYENNYFLVYPIKVNQSRRVVEALIDSKQFLGLEAGSKAELLAVLAYAGATRTVIVLSLIHISEPTRPY